ncbi:MAG: SurA N-terminal domain-containing protein [Gammaproteobacteria bacterium]
MSGIQTIRQGLTGNVTKVIVIAIIVTFIGSVGWAGFFSQGSANVVVTVGDQEITTTDLSFEYSSQQDLLSERFPDQIIEEDIILEIATNSLISKFSVMDYLESRDLNLSDDYILKQLADSAQFQENGRFSQASFDAFARSNGFIPSEYIQRIREDLLSNMWRISLLNSSFVTDRQIQNSMSLAEQERDISFIRFLSSEFQEAIDYSDLELSEYYSNNLQDYITPAKAKVSYIELDADTLVASIEVSPEEIKESYEDYLSDFDTTTRKTVSHIMLNIDDTRNEEEAIDSLIEIKDKLVTGGNFENFVKEVSEDGGTKDQGGSLGITDGTLFPPEFESALASMSEGDISDPIVLQDSVHLLKLVSLNEPTPQTLEERSDQIRNKLANEKAEDKYFQILDEVSEQSFNTDDLNQIASSIPFSVTQLDYFSENNTPDLLNKANIRQFIFDDYENTNFPELFENEELQAVLVLVESRQDEIQLTFDQSRDQIIKDYVESAAISSSELFASEQLSSLNEGKSLEKIAEENDKQIETYVKLKRDSALLPINSIDNIFSISRNKAGNSFDSILLSSGDVLIYRLDAVRSGGNSFNEEQVASLSDFLDQQFSLSELSELETNLKDSLSVQRFD